MSTPPNWHSNTHRTKWAKKWLQDTGDTGLPGQPGGVSLEALSAFVPPRPSKQDDGEKKRRPKKYEPQFQIGRQLQSWDTYTGPGSRKGNANANNIPSLRGGSGRPVRTIRLDHDGVRLDQDGNRKGPGPGRGQWGLNPAENQEDGPFWFRGPRPRRNNWHSPEYLAASVAAAGRRTVRPRGVALQEQNRRRAVYMGGQGVAGGGGQGLFGAEIPAEQGQGGFGSHRSSRQASQQFGGVGGFASRRSEGELGSQNPGGFGGSARSSGARGSRQSQGGGFGQGF